MEYEQKSLFDCIPTPFDLDEDLIKDDDNYFTAPFNRSRMEQYVLIYLYHYQIQLLRFYVYSVSEKCSL